jgi:DNA modification methylase/integrase
LATAYLEDYKVRHRAATFAEYAVGHVTRLLGDKMVVEISEKTVKGYQTTRLKEKAAPKSVNEEVGFLLRLMGDAGEALRARLRREKALKLKVSQNVARAFTPEEKDRMLALAKASSSRKSGSPAIHAALTLALNAGMRDAEIRNLTWAQVDFEKQFLTVGKSKTDAGEGRTIPLNSVQLPALLDHSRWYTRRFGMMRPEWFLFPFGKSKHLDPTRPMTSLKTVWTNIKEKAKIAGRWHDDARIAPAMARNIEVWPVERLAPYALNARTHSAEQVAQIAASIVEFGFVNPILVDSTDGVIAGHGRLLAARQLGMAEVPVVVLAHLTPAQRRALVIVDNKLAMNAGWDEEVLRSELESLGADGFNLSLVGFSDEDLVVLLAGDEPEDVAEAAEEAVAEPPAAPVTRAGDVWLIGTHRLICGDCRELATVKKLMAGARANVAITSPPYATQREYDPSSGFKPVPPDEYVEWFRAVSAGIEAVLAPDGSYLLNIKAHADEGERHLYVMDLVLAHKRAWGWRFVDEFCWRKTDNGVPGGWGNRFKNAFEPVFHFSLQKQIKFRAEAVSHASEDCFDYSPDNPKSNSGSGLLGTGARGAAAGGDASDSEGRHVGLARPSNVIEVKSESSQGAHSAAFPRALVEFFVKAFSDAGDVVLDPFMGSGTTMAAAHALGRSGYGCEISPAYCDVIVRRMMGLGLEAVLESSGEPFADVAVVRGVEQAQSLSPAL